MSQPPRIDRQREHQANERTFLAWVRTSIALISFGLALARFGLFLRELQQGMAQTELPPHPIGSQTIGLVLVLAGMVMIVLAAWSYNRAYWQIEQGNYQSNRLIIWITTLVMLLIGGLSLPFVLWQPTSGGAGQGRTGQMKSQVNLPRMRTMRTTTAPRSHKLGRLEKRVEALEIEVYAKRFCDSRRMKLYRHRSLGKRQTVA